MQSLHELDTTVGAVQLQSSYMSRFNAGTNKRTTSSSRSERDGDQDLQKALASVDLSLLTRHLLPSECVREDNCIWDVDKLTERLSQEVLEMTENDNIVGDILV